MAEQFEETARGRVGELLRKEMPSLSDQEITELLDDVDLGWPTTKEWKLENWVERVKTKLKERKQS